MQVKNTFFILQVLLTLRAFMRALENENTLNTKVGFWQIQTCQGKQINRKTPFKIVRVNVALPDFCRCQAGLKKRYQTVLGPML